jgi:hypothetical protein
MENINVYIRIKPSNSIEKIFNIPEIAYPTSQVQLFNKKTNEYYTFGK